MKGKVRQCFLTKCLLMKECEEVCKLKIKEYGFPLFDWGGSGAGSEPVPGLEPVFAFEELTLGQEKWFQSGKNCS